MLRARSWILGPAMAVSASCAAAPPRSTPVAHPAPVHATDASSAADAAASPDAARAVPDRPTAADDVRARIDELTPVPRETAAWVRFDLLAQVRRETGGELLASTAPGVRGDRVVWSLVAPEGSGHDEAFYRAVCARVTAAMTHVICSVDSVEIGALTRPRIAFGWRREGDEAPADLALPLRALGRIHDDGVCLLAAERTLRTLELRLQVRDLRALGGALALLAMAPHLAELVLIDSENAGSGAINARLSWSTDRADRDHGELGDDPWPARCADHLTVGADAPAHSHVTALFAIEGTHARGAVVNVARHEWLVTDGDALGDASVSSVSPRGVFVAHAGAAHPTLAPYRTPGRALRTGTTAVRPQPPPVVAPRLGPVHIPPPPEPPATP